MLGLQKQSWYTPLVEVNQAFLAWSFKSKTRSCSLYWTRERTESEKPELIHTSCRSESSYNSLVVLDKDSKLLFILDKRERENRRWKARADTHLL